MVKRIILTTVLLIFVATAAEAIVFKKGDKVMHMQTGKVYEFNLDADIGIYGADSGLGDLYIVNGKAYAITPEGVEGMKAVSNAVDLQTELDKTLKLYHEKRSEAGRAWKYLAAEKRKTELLRKAGKNYRKAVEVAERVIESKEKEIAELKEKIVKLETIVGLADQALGESKDALTAVDGVIKDHKKSRKLLIAYLIILAAITAFMVAGRAIYHRRTKRKVVEEIPEPTEEMETIDLTDLT